MTASTTQPTVNDLPFMQRYLVAPKILNLLLNIASYTSQVYFIFYCKKILYISSDDYGLFVNLSSAMACFLGVNVWTFVADRLKAHRSVLITSSICYACFFLMTFFKPYDLENRALKIAYVSLFYGLQNACCSAMYPLLDNQVMMLLSKHPLFSKELYSRQRLFGTVGHALSSLVVGYVCTQENGYRGMFVANFISTMAFALAVVLLIPADSTSHLGEKDVTDLKQAETDIDEKVTTSGGNSKSASLDTEANVTKRSKPKFFTLLKDPSFTFFLLVIFVTGVAKHVLSLFSALFVNARYGLKEAKVGVSQATHAVPEILLFFFGKEINQAIGLHWMLIIAQLATILRVLVFAFAPPDWTWVAYVIEAFKGVSTSLLIMSGVRLSHELAPPGLEATAQGAFVAVFQGLATAVSGIANFLVPSQKDVHKDDADAEKFILLFKYTGYISLAAVILLAMKWAYFDRVICVKRK
jgi:Na+/melibiose symporter-like transporter